MTATAGTRNLPRPSSIVEKDGTCTISLVLHKVTDLLDTDADIPADYVALNEHVLEFLSETIDRFPKDEQFVLDVYLPDEARSIVESIYREDVCSVFRSYFGKRISYLKRALRKHFHNGFLMLAYGVAFLLVCMLIREQVPEKDDIAFIASIREGLLVIGWVALWRPVEELIFNWWPITDERRVWQRLSTMKINVMSLDELKKS